MTLLEAERQLQMLLETPKGCYVELNDLVRAAISKARKLCHKEGCRKLERERNKED